MYFGCVPILTESFMARRYQDLGLPILVVDSYADLEGYDEKTLAQMYERLRNRFISKALWMPFWVERIRNINQKS